MLTWILNHGYYVGAALAAVALFMIIWGLFLHLERSWYRRQDDELRRDLELRDDIGVPYEDDRPH